MSEGENRIVSETDRIANGSFPLPKGEGTAIPRTRDAGRVRGQLRG